MPRYGLRSCIKGGKGEGRGRKKRMAGIRRKEGSVRSECGTRAVYVIASFQRDEKVGEKERRSCTKGGRKARKGSFLVPSYISRAAFSFAPASRGDTPRIRTSFALAPARSRAVDNACVLLPLSTLLSLFPSVVRTLGVINARPAAVARTSPPEERIALGCLQVIRLYAEDRSTREAKR